MSALRAAVEEVGSWDAISVIFSGVICGCGYDCDCGFGLLSERTKFPRTFSAL